ncbi:uncharacterized protein LOC105387303 [Plutella xylostella]|uniref:uncharacterized protein LOC105387303 n=1 Tax=Plutella xylostella TaxID=51655 RepID=UPI002032B456|nr:uncharacterized protein LOC105387303 [Plutella xylostella]
MKLVIALALLAVAAADIQPVALPPVVLPADAAQYQAAELAEAQAISKSELETIRIVLPEGSDAVRVAEAPLPEVVRVVDAAPAASKIQVVEAPAQGSWQPVRVDPKRPYARGKVFENPMWR